MRGSVRKRGDTWTAIVYLGRDPQTGKPRYKWQGGYRTKSEAEAALTDRLAEVNRGTYTEPTRQTVAEFLREWSAGAKARGLRRSTLVGYEVAIERWIVPRIGSVRLDRLTPGHLNAMYADLLESGRTQSEGGLSPRSVRIAHSLIRRALKDAVKWGQLSRNVADAADPPSTARTKAEARQTMKLWSAEELRRFLESVSSDRLHALWLLAATTGMRRGELLGLRWGDVDLEAKRLTITQTLVAPRYQLQLSEPKTATGRRSVSLDEGTVSVLKAHKRRQLEERLAFGAGWGEHELATDLVFRDEAGRPLVPTIVTQRFQTLARRAKLPVIKLHGLRHSHATPLMKAGVPLPAVADRLGHSSAAFTADYYSHVRSELQADTAELGAALVFGPAVAERRPR